MAKPSEISSGATSSRSLTCTTALCALRLARGSCKKSRHKLVRLYALNRKTAIVKIKGYVEKALDSSTLSTKQDCLLRGCLEGKNQDGSG